jgi:hypothetical protein
VTPKRAPIFDAATRAAALLRAEECGDRVAASEIGCSPATIRSWRLRAKAGLAHTEAPAELADPDELLRKARAARSAEARALRRVDELLAASRAHDARSASTVARDHQFRAQQLEGQARLQREHTARLAEARARLSHHEARLFEKLARVCLTALGIGWGTAQQALLDAVLHAFATAEPDDEGRVTIKVPESEAAAARRAVARLYRREPPKPKAEARPDPPRPIAPPDPPQNAEPESSLPPDWRAQYSPQLTAPQESRFGVKRWTHPGMRGAW